MPFRPHDAAVHCIGRSRALLALGQAQGNTAVAADLRRLAVVMAVAALDTYMHRLIVHRAYRAHPLPRNLAALTLSFEHALEQADAAAAAARAQPHNSRPRAPLKRALRNRLLFETFQRYDDVADALAMAGLSGNWQAIGQALQPPLHPNDIRERLNGIVSRRNQIVHEGDYERLERPQTARKNAITHSEARADVDFLADLIDAIHSVA